jgi:hypothetical protein
MRLLIRTRFSVKPELQTNFLKKLDDYMNMFKPGSIAYFMPIVSQKSVALIVNVERNDQLPAIVEHLFHWMGANVDVIPIMNSDDLKMGLDNR